MRKQKLFIAIASLLIAVVVLAGCSSTPKEQTAYELVKSAVEKTTALDSSEMNLNMNMKMSLMGMTVEIPMKYSIKSAKEGEDTIALANMEMTVTGQSVKADIFVDKDYVYINEPNSNAKIKVSLKDDLAKTYNVKSFSESIIKTLPEDILKDVTVTKDDNGNRTVDVQISEEKFNELFKGYIDSALSGALSEISETDTTIKFSNTKVNITVDKNGYISKYNLAFDMNMKMEMQGITMDINASCDSVCSFVNPGTKVVVERPADLDTYQEISE